MHRILLCVSLSAAGLVGAHAQIIPVDRADGAPNQRPVRVAAVRSAAQGAPPEFSADALLHLVEHRHVTSRSEAAEIIEDALRAAMNAQEHVPLRQVFGGSESVSGAVRNAVLAGFDSMSLQLRAAAAMAQYNPLRSREILESIPLNLPGPLSCEDQMMAGFAPFYKKLAPLLDQVYRGDDRLRLGEIDLIRRQISSMDRVELLAPIFRLVADVNLTNGDRNALVPLLTERVRKLSVNWRALIGYLMIGELPDAVRALVGQLDQSSAAQLVDSMRVLYAKHLAADRCPDLAPKEPDSGRVIQSFNTTLLPLGNRSLTRPLQVEEVKGRVLPAERFNDRFWRTPDSDMMRKWTYLVHVETDEQSKQLSDWRAQANNLLDALIDWKGESEDSPDMFYLEKSTLLRLIVMRPLSPAIPANASREQLREYLANADRRADTYDAPKALRVLVQFFDSSTGDQTYSRRRLIWYGPVYDLINRTLYQFKDDLPGVTALFQVCRNPVLRLQGMLLALDYQPDQ